MWRAYTFVHDAGVCVGICCVCMCVPNKRAAVKNTHEVKNFRARVTGEKNEVMVFYNQAMVLTWLIRIQYIYLPIPRAIDSNSLSVTINT